MDTPPIIRAIEATGGQRQLASLLEVHPSLISQWVTGRRPVAANHVLAIESATDGKVTRHDLRPDVFGAAPAHQAAAAPSGDEAAGLTRAA